MPLYCVLKQNIDLQFIQSIYRLYLKKFIEAHHCVKQPSQLVDMSGQLHVFLRCLGCRRLAGNMNLPLTVGQ